MSARSPRPPGSLAQALQGAPVASVHRGDLTTDGYRAAIAAVKKAIVTE